jgi:hypothetical protein
MLPPTTKSLREIAEYKDAVVRVPLLGTLLEGLLKSITPYADGLSLDPLLDKHKEKFAKFRDVDAARWVRNQITHGSGRATTPQILEAEVGFEQAIRDILPHCSEQLRYEAVGKREPVSQPAPEDPPVSTQPEPSSTAPDPPVAETLPRTSASGSAAPLRPAPPSDDGYQFKSARLWYALTGVFLFGSGVAYILRAQRPRPRSVLIGDQPATLFSRPTSTPSSESDRREPPRPTIDYRAQREAGFRALINTNLSLSSSQPNVAFVIETTGTETVGSVPDALQGFLVGAKVHLIGNLADARALSGAGFFDDLYSGNGRFLSLAAKLSRVDYILLGRASYSFRRQPALDEALLTCDLTLSCRLVDRNGTVVQSGTFAATGPGFTQSQALERAAENTARQLQERLLDAIP